jgi:vacuolar-type H+-ATPase subunit C/Vma6
MRLLQDRKDQGYPEEYLMARIRGRRSCLVKEWKPLIFDPGPFGQGVVRTTKNVLMDSSAELVWRNLVREYAWVYGQMNLRLRKIFAPFFLYSEIRTIVVCLRHVKEKTAGTIAELLTVSLLSDEIKDVLVTSTDVLSAISRLERIFLTLSPDFDGLAAALEEEDLRGVERRLTETYLAITVRADLHPLMQRFFQRLIDSRNIMSLYTSLRFEHKAEPSFISGGTMPLSGMKEIVQKEGIPGICSLVREFTGIKIEKPEPTAVEVALYKGMTRWLKKNGREPFGIGLVLDYLWRCSIEAMNWSVLYYGKELEREVVAAELVH